MTTEPQAVATKIPLTYIDADNGNCRVYYKSAKALYCWQLASRDAFELLVCSRDGEPSHNANPDAFTTPEPAGDERVEEELRRFLAAQGA